MKKFVLAIVTVAATAGVAYAAAPDTMAAAFNACCGILASCCQGGSCC